MSTKQTSPPTPVPYDEHERETIALIEDRDRMHEIADRLAYAIAPHEVIGEHSNLNSPWENAAEIAENSVLFYPNTETTIRVARAIHGEYRKTNPSIHESGWDDIDPVAREQWMAEAVAAIEALKGTQL